MSDLVYRLARSQARGWRQAGFVNELLSFKPVKFKAVYYPEGVEFLFGDSELPYRSWKNLRSRLSVVGFVFLTEQAKGTVTMKFPENRD